MDSDHNYPSHKKGNKNASQNLSSSSSTSPPSPMLVHQERCLSVSPAATPALCANTSLLVLLAPRLNTITYPALATRNKDIASAFVRQRQQHEYQDYGMLQSLNNLIIIEKKDGALVLPSPPTSSNVHALLMHAKETKDNQASSADADVRPLIDHTSQVVSPTSFASSEQKKYKKTHNSTINHNQHDQDTQDIVLVCKTAESFNLGRDYQLSNYDVLCGRGKRSLNNIGNRRFRLSTSIFMHKYCSSRQRAAKQSVIAEVIGIIRSARGHFLKQDKLSKEWIDIGDKAAAEKVGHCFRDHCAERLKSTSKTTGTISGNMTKAAAKKRQITNHNSNNKLSRALVCTKDPWEQGPENEEQNNIIEMEDVKIEFPLKAAGATTTAREEEINVLDTFIFEHLVDLPEDMLSSSLDAHEISLALTLV